MSDTETPDPETPEPADAELAPEDQPCMPCHGTGTVISNRGGTPNEVECPWCNGSGKRIPGHDAQARWASDGDAGPGQAAESSDSDSSDEPPSAA